MAGIVLPFAIKGFVERNPFPMVTIFNLLRSMYLLWTINKISTSLLTFLLKTGIIETKKNVESVMDSKSFPWETFIGG